MQSEQDTANGTTWTDYLYAGGQMIGMHVTPAGGAAYNRFFILDHLGSMAVMTGDVGCVGLTYGGANSCLVERKSYDAWGKRRFATNWADDTNSTLVSATTRGFTGHEMVHAPGFDLITMNARFYDPATARFMSTDPLIQDVTNLQDLNPYSYVLNNPLSAIDPSGACGGLFGFIVCPIVHLYEGTINLFKRNPILGDVFIAAAGFGCGAFAPLCVGAATATIDGFETGKLGVGLENGAIAGAEVGAFHLVGLYSGEELGLGNIAWAAANPLGYAEDVAGDGLVGGLASLASGGSFESGFLASGFAGAAGVLQFSQFGAEGNLLANLSAQSVEGGLGSIIGGGNFANGAETGAFRYLFSPEAQAVQNGQNPLDQISQGIDYLGDHIELGYDDLLGINPNLTEQSLNYVAFNINPNTATPTSPNDIEQVKAPFTCDGPNSSCALIPGSKTPGTYQDPDNPGFRLCLDCFIKSQGRKPNGGDS